MLANGSISSFEHLKYLFLHKFMYLRKVKGNANSIMESKQKEGEFIRAYYDQFTLTTLSVPGHEEFLVTGAFAQGLLPSPLSRKMQGTVSISRDKNTSGRLREKNANKPI